MPDESGLVLAKFCEWEVVGDEADGEGVKGMMEVGQATDLVFGFWDPFENGVATWAVSLGD